MQRSDFSRPPGFIMPLWLRIGLASLLFLCSALQVRKGFLHLDWLPWFCMGCYYLLLVPRRRGESFGPYLKAPRTVASNALFVAALVGFGHNLYVLFKK